MSRIISWQGSIKSNLKRRSDTELEQALVRLAISLMVSIYLITLLALQDNSALNVAFFAAFGAFSIIIIVSIIIQPQVSPLRRTIGIIVDMTAITYCLYISSEAGAVIFFLYLWVIVGNGLRFGKPYLYGAMAAALVGFGFVAMNNNYWIANPSVAIGVLISFLALPLYFSVLLGRLQEARQSLESRVERRTAELAIERNKALAASLAKSQFLANMSHELRTPLNAIIGYGEMLEEDAEVTGEKEMLEGLQKITRSGRHLLDMICDILDLTKIEAGKVTVNPHPIDLCPFIEGLNDAIKPLMDINNNRLIIDNVEEQVTVVVDELRLKQILLNLLSNAAKFTIDGVIHLYVEFESEGEKDKVLIKVEDNGIGIAQHHLGEIFKPFSQADETYTRNHGGSGLGLAISQNFCEMMGGKIEVQSKLGQGSIFSVVLPLNLSHLAPFVKEMPI